MHGEQGPWSNRPGFDEIGAAVSGLFTIEGSPTRPKQPPIVPIADNVVGWLGATGILAALRRRAIEGGSYRVVVSLTRTVLWLLSLGIFDKAYAKATADSGDEHKLHRSGPVYRGNTAWYLLGNDGPNRIVAHTRRLPNRPGSARLKQTRMAGKMTA